jgi:response regulator RpfG family c-di-GMP phosphodiesterase
MLQPAGSGGAGGPRQDRGRIAMKVLYIEDNEDDVYMLTMRLELLGDFEILAAQNGEKGCEMAVSERPDIIIMDLEMPVMDGWEAARWLKSKPQTRDIPIIARRRMHCPASAKGRLRRVVTSCWQAFAVLARAASDAAG